MLRRKKETKPLPTTDGYEHMMGNPMNVVDHPSYNMGAPGLYDDQGY